MNILLLDASTPFEIIALKKGDLYFDNSSAAAVSHSRTIFTGIDSCLKKAGLEIKDINIFAVGVGPGSFTGIRIAVSTARMLAQVLGVKTAAISSQLIFALSADSSDGDFLLPAFDAKKGRVFAALYRKEKSDLNVILPPGDYNISSMLEKIPAGSKTLFMGDGCAKFRSLIDAADCDKTVIENFIPSGVNSLKYLSGLFEKGNLLPLDYDRIVPDYSRKSDAEIALEALRK